MARTKQVRGFVVAWLMFMAIVLIYCVSEKTHEIIYLAPRLALDNTRRLCKGLSRFVPFPFSGRSQTARAKAPAGGGQSDRERQEREEEAKKKKELKDLLTAFIDEDFKTPPLCTAATKGNVGLVVALLDKLGADKNFKDNVGETPLMKAADNDHLPVVEALLAAGVDVNITAADGYTALHGAADKGYDGIVDALLKNGAEKDARDNSGGTPLMEAAFNGRLPVVKTLLDKHADVNIADAKGSTALTGAAQEGHETIVDALLDDGADMNASDNEGGTALMLAAFNGRMPVVKTLLATHVDVNQTDDRGDTAFHYAAYGGHDGIVRALLRTKKVDINNIGHAGATALTQVAERGHLPVVKTLLAAGADVNISADKGMTALLAAAIHERWPVVEILLEADADPTARLGGGYKPYSALDLAAEEGQVRIMKAIIQRRVDVNEEDEDSQTTLLKAVRKDQAGAIDVLIEAGAKNGNDRAFQHAFAIACKQAKCRSMLALLQHGAEMEMVDTYGRTALHLVCQDSAENAEAAVSLLLKWGADETALGKDGKTPADLVNPNGKWFLGKPLSQDAVERVRLLLARAPADRAWRRRGWLVMLRSRTLKAGGSTGDAGERSVKQRNGAGEKTNGAGGDGGAAGALSVKQRGGADEETNGAGSGKERFDLSAAVEWLRGVEGGVFRNIVGFL